VLGTLRLPLVLLLSGDASAAAGTNIAISAASAASGGYRHARAGRVDRRVVAWMTPPSVAGALVGGLFGHSVPSSLLLGGAAAVLAWNGIDLIARPFREHPAERPRIAPAVGFGFLIGLVGGALGVILGTLRMPALLRGVGLSAKQAVGTNLVVGFALGVVGFLAHLSRLEVDWGILAAGVPGALLGAWAGAPVAGRAPEELLRRAIGATLLVVAAAFVVELALR
jgi:uncharacterized membrane protein YfcA